MQVFKKETITNEFIIIELINCKFVENYVKQRYSMSQYHKDIVQDIYLMLLEYPKLTQIYKEKGLSGVRALASGMIQRAISKSGALYRKYTRENQWLNMEEFIIDDEKLEIL